MQSYSGCKVKRNQFYGVYRSLYMEFMQIVREGSMSSSLERECDNVRGKSNIDWELNVSYILCLIFEFGRLILFDTITKS